MFNILKLYKTMQSATAQVGNMLGAAAFISHGMEEIPDNALRLLSRDETARLLLFTECEELIDGIAKLKAEMAERVATTEVK